MRTQLKIAFFVAATMAIPSFALGATRGFQGLPWGASKQAVIHQFAGQIALHKCDKEWAEKAKFVNITCDGPYIEHYEVLGIPFRLEFYMSEKTNKLMSVGLSYSSDSDPTANPDAESWQEGYSRLYRALVIKYGQPRTPSETASKGDTTVSTATWVTQDTIIELTSIVGKASPESPNLGEYTISYRPSKTSASSRL